MKGIVKTEKFILKNGMWSKVEEWTEADAIIDYAHWDSWRRFDSVGSPRRATLRGQCGYMLTYTAYGPSGKEKIKVKLLRHTFDHRIMEAFDNLSNITDKEFKKLQKRAEACAKYHGIDLSEACFITSCGCGHGFYLPNSEKWRGIFFCRGEAVAVTNKLAE